MWIDPEIGSLQVICIKSFLAKGHEFYLYTYNEICNIPEGVVVKDANEILNERFIFRDLYDSYATFSDWFRVKLLYDIGGWWVDCDVLCLKEFNISWPYVFATEVVKEGNNERIDLCNAILKMPKGSVAGNAVLKHINRRLESGDVKSINWTEIGAAALKSAIVDSNLLDYIVAPKVFCPVDHLDFKKSLMLSRQSIDDETYGIHLWNKMWEWHRLNPFGEPNSDSFLKGFL